MQTDEEMDRLRQALNNEEERLRDEAKAQELPAEPQAHPDEDALNRVARDFVTPGTPACGLFGLVIGLSIAALLLTVGVGKTLLIVALGFAGAVLGGVHSKAQCVKNIINRLFPPKD